MRAFWRSIVGQVPNQSLRTSNFPGGFAGGVTINGVSIVNSYSGGLYYVDSQTGSNTNKGTFNQPWATIAYALTRVIANRGDVVLVKAGHSETVTAAAGILAAVAGCAVLGLGTGTDRPTINFTTSTAATLKVTAANVYLGNLLFTCGIASQVTMLDIQGTYCVVDGCGFSEGTQTGASFITLAGAANAADHLRILNSKFYNPTSGNMASAIGLAIVEDDVQVAGNQILGNFSLSGIHNVTAKVLTNLTVNDNYVHNLAAAKPAMNLISACTGQAFGNVFEPGDSTVASALYGSLDFSGNNVEINGRADAGGEFWYVKKGVVSSTITQAGVAVSAASTGGELAIEDVIVKTNGTGLAGGTNFSLKSNNSNGVAIFLTESVANLGANKTVNMTNASVTANGRTVLESGKILTALSTVADCTGAGTIDIYVKMRRITAGATITQV